MQVKRMMKILVFLLMGLIFIIENAICEATPLIQKGDYGQDVISLHRKLNELGFLQLRSESPFGPQSENGLKILQNSVLLKETGIVQDREELEKLLSANIKECQNLSENTEIEVVVEPKGANSYCSPKELFPTSEQGMVLLQNKDNKYFTVMFDWHVVDADTPVNASIMLRYVGDVTRYASVGKFSIPIGESYGKCMVTFTPTDEMRMYGTDWLIGDIGESNRGIKIYISNFKLSLTRDLISLD